MQDGTYGAGRLLPSESELGSEFDASRVTIRRALETLRDDGLVDARQGFGWFVAAALAEGGRVTDMTWRWVRYETKRGAGRTIWNVAICCDRSAFDTAL